ncbi:MULTISPECIES: lytic polysaccharide monooxygenase [Legionella]|uniref:Lytic polysaccharide monooxygenase n=1 Tax=Legionella resiliens TaxID=2905958 RepID=A0ABS8XAS8_9GAMM|nr:MULTISPECIES: lytic polysaccharide monooxygenase [unclassified Legionella]MCE0724156.1 lytic polysaccharide monooxygenase [Legionella sp. 9fVS26]MCE3533309.1 lytic polysaccharide monooxygenase [Legionella sp. 8cVS16]QLZ69489.1 GlcNAc-binding protein A [Legionella sp. PC1000]
MNKRNPFIIGCILLFVFNLSGFAHGVIESPPSREQFCGVESKPDEIYKDKMTHEKCRPIMTKEDGSLDNSVYNFMAVLTHTIGRSNKPMDQLPTHVCGFNSEMWGGGKTPWDNAIDWPTTLIGSGEQKFIWNISWGNHFGDTEEFVYWITKSDFQFDPNKELTWDDFESTPFCKLNYNDQSPNANPNVIPDKVNNRFTTLCNVPVRQNRAVIYGEWGRNKSTYERFHSCMDVVFSTDNTPSIKAVINPLPTQISGSAELELDGSNSVGTNLSYSWSIDADNLAAYQLTDSQNAKAHLTIANINAQQPVTVNLTIKQGDAVDHSSIEFTHLPAISSSWQLVGKATVATTLKPGDGVQLRLIDNAGKDYFIPTAPIILDENTAKPENWAYTLAQATNAGNNFSAKIGVLAADNKTVEPVRSPLENRIYVPVTSSITNGYIHVISGNNPGQTCTAIRMEGSSTYWLGYDVYTDKAPFVLNFSATGIDLTKIIIAPGVFSNIQVLDKDNLLINIKPDWVSKTVPGYIGFHGPNYGSYDPFNNPTPANCQTNLFSK